MRESLWLVKIPMQILQIKPQLRNNRTLYLFLEWLLSVSFVFRISPITTKIRYTRPPYRKTSQTLCL